MMIVERHTIGLMLLALIAIVAALSAVLSIARSRERARFQQRNYQGSRPWWARRS